MIYVILTKREKKANKVQQEHNLARLFAANKQASYTHPTISSQLSSKYSDGFHTKSYCTHLIQRVDQDLEESSAANATEAKLWGTVRFGDTQQERVHCVRKRVDYQEERVDCEGEAMNNA